MASRAKLKPDRLSVKGDSRKYWLNGSGFNQLNILETIYYVSLLLLRWQFLRSISSKFFSMSKFFHRETWKVCYTKTIFNLRQTTVACTAWKITFKVFWLVGWLEFGGCCESNGFNRIRSSSEARLWCKERQPICCQRRWFTLSSTSSHLFCRLPVQVPSDRQCWCGEILPPPPVHREQV